MYRDGSFAYDIGKNQGGPSDQFKNILFGLV